MWVIHAILSCTILFFMPFTSYAQSPSIHEIIGIHEGVGETITFTHFNQRFHLKLSDYVFHWMGVQLLDMEKVNKKMDVIHDQISKKPQNAYINHYGKVISHHYGIDLDRKKFISLLHDNLYTETGLTETLPIQFAPPRVTTDSLMQSKEKLLTSFSSYYNSANTNRSHNISLASKALHHYVVLPGETFSFNSVVGKRTKEKGYKRAAVIVRGEMSEDIGGGICQVSSTLFNAVDRASLSIVKRYSHSKKVGYVPPGRDATVSWYGPDFKFQNNFDFPLMIKSYAGYGTVTIQIFSSKNINTRLKTVPNAPTQLPEESQHTQ